MQLSVEKCVSPKIEIFHVMFHSSGQVLLNRFCVLNHRTEMKKLNLFIKQQHEKSNKC